MVCAKAAKRKTRVASTRDSILIHTKGDAEKDLHLRMIISSNICQTGNNSHIVMVIAGNCVRLTSEQNTV